MSVLNDMSLHEAAGYYKMVGLLIHPLKSQEKKPIIGKWTDISRHFTDEELKEYFATGKPKNIGLICGQKSDCTIIDRDFIVKGMWEGLEASQLVRQQRTGNRDHLFFRYCDELKAKKYHALGFEILNNGNNCVLTPSIHPTGNKYQFTQGEPENRPQMSRELIDRIKANIATFEALQKTVNKCRPVFRKFFKAYFTDNQKSNPRYRDMSVFHGASGRELNLYLFAELKANGASFDEMDLLCKLIFLDDYDKANSEYQIGKIDQSRTATQATIKAHSVLSQFYDDREDNRHVVSQDKRKNPVSDVIERVRQVREEMRTYQDLPESERVAVCREIWGASGLNGRDFKTAYDETFKEEKEDEDKNSLFDIYPDYVIEEAEHVLKNGDPKKYILDTWNKSHVGDREIGEVYACSFASTFIVNSDGEHIKPSGKSGKGKSSSGKKFGNLIPRNRFFIGSMSGKAALYHELKPGMVLLLDDVALNEDLISLIKQATTNFQAGTVHKTVKDQTALELSIPPRCAWWLNSVDGFDDEQLNNRFLGVDVDDTEKQDEKVFQHQIDDELNFSTCDTKEVMVCRCMYEMLAQELYDIRIPFLGDNRLQWNNKNNRRNLPMLKDIIRSVTLYRIRQREKVGSFYLSTVDDFDEGLRIYRQLAESNYTNLTKTELKAMRAMNKPMVFRKDIEKATGLTQTGALHLMEGKKGDGGLISKIVGLRKEREENDKRRYYYTYSGKFGLDSYEGVAILNKDGIEATIDEFKKKLTCSEAYTSYTQLTPSLHPTGVTHKTNTVDIINTSLTPNNRELQGINVNHMLNDGQVSSTPKKDQNNNMSLTCGESGVSEKKAGTADTKTLTPKKSEEGVSGVSNGSKDSPDIDNFLTPDAVDVYKWLSDWEHVKRTKINSHNYQDAAAEYAQKFKGELSEIEFITCKYAGIDEVFT